MQQLRKLEEQYPQFLTPDSPTQSVGAAPIDALGIVEHPLPLLSLGNAFVTEDLYAWHARTLKLLGVTQFDMVCEHKMDGLAIALTYVNGQFVQRRHARRRLSRRGYHPKSKDDSQYSPFRPKRRAAELRSPRRGLFAQSRVPEAQ